MGFDFNIKLRLSLCETTGKPFIWDYTQEVITKNYDLSTITVPEEYRGFTTMRGHIFHLYTTDVLSIDTCEAEIDSLLENFPSWEDIQAEQDNDDEWWTEKDHTLFHDALIWFNMQRYSFYATWSY
jgi:hypothetical protein